jgi:GT2 family glycosyltransferase
MINVAVIITTYNRKETTLQSLASLYATDYAQYFKLTLHIVDAGSADGTVDAISEVYPEARISSATQDVFWNQGMRLAWLEATRHIDYDAYLLFNDDILLYPNVFSQLQSTIVYQQENYDNIGVIIGSFCSSSKLSPPVLTYGGRNQSGLVYPADHPLEVTTFNGNFVYVSKQVFNEIGILSNSYRHSFGDIDYGIRVHKAGLPLHIVPGFVGICDRNPPPDWKNPKITLRKRLKFARSPKGASYNEIKAICKTEGKRFPILRFLKFYLIVIFPFFVR